MNTKDNIRLTERIVNWLDIGVFVVNLRMEITLWNNFMANHSRRSAKEVIGRNLFECFPELPKNWLGKKIQGVFLIKNLAFTSWEQRHYLFNFPHNRPITGKVDYMYQNLTFMPLKNDAGEIESVCITLVDATDIGIAQTALKDAMERITDNSNRDGLTGIYNRRYLEQQLSAEYDRCKRYSGQFSFLLFDLDHFKKVNDTYGHLAGDKVLCVVTERINSLLRSVDIFGRYGGEEFGIMLPSTPVSGASILAERLRQSIAKEPVMYKETAIPVTISGGVVEFEPETPNYENLILCADIALYYGKENGRNQFTIYTPEMELNR